MIANFFQSLSDRRVEYLLISGQATVLYGAATFSEDVDLWLNPTEENCRRFLAALRDNGARFYKLTPPFTIEYLVRGHGFHFVLPAQDEIDAFLDIMGAPPRVASFASALATARTMETEWGKLPTIGLQSLVELKKTQRLEDYPIISKLALAWFDQPECTKAARDFIWASDNLFTVPELRIFFENEPDALAAIDDEPEPGLKEFARELLSKGEVTEDVAVRVNLGMQERIARLQQGDRTYWRPIISELKQLRSADKLMSEGSEV